MSTDITIERRMTSAALRPAFCQLCQSTPGREVHLTQDLTDLIRTLSESEDAEEGFYSFIGRVRHGDPLAIVLAEGYINGTVDLIGIRNGEPVWIGTDTAAAEVSHA